MTDLFHAHGHPWLAQRDPRIRVMTALAASIAILALNSYVASTTALALALVFAGSSNTFTRRVRQRLIGLNLFMLLLIAVLPLAEPGDTMFALGPLQYAREGFDAAALIP